MFSPRQERDALKREEEVEELKSVDEYFKNCDIWPGGIPFEHLDKSCNRYAQNAKRRAAYLEAENASEEELIPSHVFLNLPEEKTWACPLDSGDESGNNDNEGHQELGMNTLWILHNEASTPIILSLVDENGFEVSAIDFHTFPYHGNTAVHPHGPVVLPGHMAAVEGRQGHLFLAREYNENGVFDPEELELFGSYSGTETDEASSTFSWKNYGVEETIRTVFPKTWSFAKKETRFVAKNDVMHVLGHPGRVLMKHRMGMIYVRNEGGALCQEGGVGEEDDEDFPTRHQNRYPECNVMTKGFINKVGKFHVSFREFIFYSQLFGDETL